MERNGTDSYLQTSGRAFPTCGSVRNKRRNAFTRRNTHRRCLHALKSPTVKRGTAAEQARKGCVMEIEPNQNIGPRDDDTACDYCGGPLSRGRTEYSLPDGATPFVVCPDSACQGAAQLKSGEAWAFARLRDDVASGAVTLVHGDPHKGLRTGNTLRNPMESE